MNVAERPAALKIASDADVIVARQRVRVLAREAGFSDGDQTVIAVAVSEIARNIVTYARQGEIEFAEIRDGPRRGLVIVARDHGPGIRDIHLALQDGFSTSRSLGMGLPGARRLMDEFELISGTGKGTVVTMRKWRADL